MDIKNIGDLDFSTLTSEEAAARGLNTLFREEDGTYNWIYSLKMFQNLSMLKFVLKIMAIVFAAITVMLLVMTGGSGDMVGLFGIMALVFGVVILIVFFSFWLVDKLYKGRYMLIYEMNDEGLTFSQTTDQGQITRTIASASAAASAAGGNTGGMISGTAMAMRPNSSHASFSKVRSVKGNRRDNLIWVNSFLLYLMVYVPEESYDFVWDYITTRCVNAKIKGA